MAWTIEFDRRAIRDLQGLDRSVQRRILSDLENRMAQAENPRDFGEGLRSNFAGLWRYRVGDYGVVCRMEDDRLVVLVVRVGHRREVYG